MSIYLIIPFFGKFPNYFQLYLDSLAKNVDILQVLLFTDNTDPYNYPPNLHKIEMTLDEVRTRLHKFLVDKYGYTGDATLLKAPYKLCDIRPVYHILFADYLKNPDFVGWGDIDVIYGKLSKYIDLNVDIIGGYHGHFTAIRNGSPMQKMYKDIPNYYEICITDKNYVADEIALREPLNKYMNAGHKMSYINASCCDIVPPCFYSLFRKDYNVKNFFNTLKPKINIKELHYNAETGELTTYYDNGGAQGTSYCHLQKREMALPFKSYTSGFYIRENLFSLHPLNGIRLHVPGVPYTVTRSEWSHDAFTGKVQRFGPMMRSLGYEVYHYGIETSQTNVDVHIDLLSKSKWEELRVKSMIELEGLTEDVAKAKLADHKTPVGILANWSTSLFKEFNKELRKKLQIHYRGLSTDIFCNPLGASYDEATNGFNCSEVEFGIGYSHSCKNFRVFESHNWLSATLGKQGREPHNYWFVVPHSFDVEEFRYNPAPNQLYQTVGFRHKCGFLGRVIDSKGCSIISEIAGRFPNVEFVLCGQGDPAPFLKHDNIKYVKPISGSQRSEYLGSCAAVLCLAKYLEPFGCAAVEAQLCGTPVITTDFGGPVETVEQFKTGLRGHTLADFCKGVQMALDGKFDRRYIRERAVKLYGMYNVALQYDYVLKTVLEVCNGNGGWYSNQTFIDKLMD